jgi:hypothetical protein
MDWSACFALSHFLACSLRLRVAVFDGGLPFVSFGLGSRLGCLQLVGFGCSRLIDFSLAFPAAEQLEIGIEMGPT